MSLLIYMKSYLGEINDLLGWSDSNYDFPISETLEVYGVDTEAEATDTKKLHALAKVELWRSVLRTLSFKYNFSADGASYSRSQIYDMAQKNFQDALTDAAEYLPAYTITVGEINTQQDPYSFYPYYLRDI